MADFEKINKARRLLGLGETATLKEVGEAYRRLALKYHPDRCRDEDKKKYAETFKKINDAKETLISYCAGYRYSFREEDVKKATLSEEYKEHLKKFYDGWWGDLKL